MKPKHTSVADPLGATPIRVVLITLDNHVSTALERAGTRLRQVIPGLSLGVHAASDWDKRPDTLERCLSDIDRGDIILVTMMFMEPHINAVLPRLTARRDQCDAMICCMSAGEVMKLTRMGRFDMGGEPTGAAALLKRLRGKPSSNKSAGAQQLSVLRRLPKILRFIPGTAQDVRAYFLTLQYWLAGSEDNLEQLVMYLVHRYAEGPRAEVAAHLNPKPPVEYPEVGVYHPDSTPRLSAELSSAKTKGKRGTVGLLLMRSYALAGNSAHYDGVIRALETKGLRVIAAFASGLDARPAVEKFFMNGEQPIVDAVVSLTGFSLVGGPAYNDTDAAQALLSRLDVPYLAVQALEFQSLDQWAESSMGLMPIEATMMVSIPELDGATGAMVFGGRSDAVPGQGEMSGDSHGRSQPGTGEGIAEHNMVPHTERIEMLVARVDKLVRLRRSKRCDRKVAIVLFNFPPNAGATGTAAHLSVFESLFNTLTALSADGYDIQLPESVDALRDAVLKGNSDRWGTDANVHERIAVNDHVREETWLEEIESQWGPAPGKVLSDGQSLFVLGAQFGNALVTIQPPMGYEGDPMRLLFEGSFAPNHAFSAFYRYLRDNYAADAVLHFGTHGALEFMPGKQVGMSGECWPDRLIGNLPNFYLYAANNPSEGLIAKRRSAATLVSYLTPGVAEADLYRDLLDLKETIDRWRSRDESTAGDSDKLPVMAAMIHAQAQICGLTDCEKPWSRSEAPAAIEAIRIQLTEVEHALVPFGLHTVGKIMPEEQRRELLKTVATASHEITLSDQFLEQLMSGTDRSTLLADPMLTELTAEQRELVLETLVNVDINLRGNHELDGILHALDGGFIAPVGGGDLIRSPDILPTGRNIHGFDPYRLPSQFAVLEGERQACQLLARHQADGGEIPKSIALVLWGTDNLKSEGIAIGQALALIGARPRLDSYGRIAGAELTPLEHLNRPRVDVVMTLSGIFRDLLPLQTRLLAEATYLAAEADEPAHLNPIRANTLAWQAAHDSDFETAALRVFSNAEGTYGANVNMLVDSGNWQDENELADTFTNRKGHAYGRDGAVAAAPELLGDLLGSVDFAYQNLDSVELGVTTIDHYFDTLGGISRAIHKVRGDDVPVYIADHTSGSGKVRTLSEQVALETRTRVLNPKWYEAMLDHGYEGVRAIETHVTNTVGWSATTGQVAPWVYQQLSETFILDESMRKRLAALNPVAAARVANRLLEAQERNYWSPDEESLEALKQAGEDLEDWIEGVSPEVAA